MSAVRPLVLSALLVVAPRLLAAQALTGRLVDPLTEQPIAGAVITLIPSGEQPHQRVVTDSAGRFAFTGGGPAGYRLGAVRVGYLPALSPEWELQGSDTLEVDFRLSSFLVLANPAHITRYTGRPALGVSGFYGRTLAADRVTFITREQVEQLLPPFTTALLDGVPGVTLVPRPPWQRPLVRLGAGCAPAVFLDGVRIRPGEGSLDDLVEPWELEGVEVYRSAAELPEELGGGIECGAIVFWTRQAS